MAKWLFNVGCNNHFSLTLDITQACKCRDEPLCWLQTAWSGACLYQDDQRFKHIVSDFSMLCLRWHYRWQDWGTCGCRNDYVLIMQQTINWTSYQRLLCFPWFISQRVYYSDVTMKVMASQITGVSIVAQPFFRVGIKENIKAPRHWLLWGEFTGHRWNPRTKG